MPTRQKRVLLILPKPFEEAGYVYLKRKFEKQGLQVRGLCSEGAPSRDELLSLVKDVDGYVSGWSETIDERTLDYANRLKVIAEFGVGVEHIDVDACTKRNIIVTIAPGANSDAVKELTIGLISSLARRICEINENTKRGIWELSLGTQLKNKTLGIVGTGNIGKRVAEVAASLGMKILAYDIRKNEDLVKEDEVRYVSLEELFRQADFVTIHIPLTLETKGLINRKYLSLMKKSACLVNTARGAVIDEEALYEVLRDEKIAGAALDVYSKEPPVGNLLLQLDNVITTSHIGGATFEAVRETARINFEEIMRALQGKKPLYVVNPEVFGTV